MTAFEKAQAKAQKQKSSKKSAQQSKGIMSFDDYFNEATEMLDDSSDYSSDGDFWDDDYTWTMDALHHHDDGNDAGVGHVAEHDIAEHEIEEHDYDENHDGIKISPEV